MTRDQIKAEVSKQRKAGKQGPLKINNKHYLEDGNGDPQEVIVCEDASLTHQEFKKDCDIEEIVKRANNGQMPNTRGTPQYLDLTAIGDYNQNLQAVIDAQDSFMELDAKIRDRFANDPSQLIKFLQDDKNKEDAIKLGLIPPPEPAKPEVVQKVEIVNPQTPPA